MNEFFFLLQIITVLLFAIATLRQGKEALSASVAIQAILANLFVLKQISFCGFEVTCSDAFAVGSFLNLNLLREYFGKGTAKKAITLSFVCMVFFVLMAQIHLLFVPTSKDLTQSAYATLLTSSPRLLLASIFVFFFVQRFDVRFFGWITRRFPKAPFPIRSGLSLIACQFLDTVCFSFLGLYGIVSSLVDVIFVSFLIKMVVILVLSPLTGLFKRLSPHV